MKTTPRWALLKLAEFPKKLVMPTAKINWGERKKRATIQGFADHGDIGEKADESLIFRGIFNNIQPISVGV